MSSVLLLTDADVFAGTERHMLDLALGLRDDGVPVRIACPVPSALAQRAAARGLPLVDVPKRGHLDLNAARVLRRLLDAREIDIIHAHNGRTHLLAALAVARAGRGACVATQHFLHPAHASRRGLKGFLSRRAHGWVNRRTAGYIAVSHAARAGMLDRREFPPDRIHVIPTGIHPLDPAILTRPSDVRRRFDVPADAPLVVCVARLQSEKRIDLLLHAIRELRSGSQDCFCVIAGDGDQREPLIELTRQLGLADRVRMTGFLDDCASVINAADVFALPSPAESFGLVLLEAMSLGKPVVAARAGGPVEIVQHGRNGLLVEPGDARQFASAIRALLADATLCATLGSNGLDRFNACFTATEMVRQTRALYQRIVAAP